MNTKGKWIFSKLFWQISAIFLIVLLVFAIITVYISAKSAGNYCVEVNQRLNCDLAKSTVEDIKLNFKNGKVNQEAIGKIVHSMMVVNPSVEVYLLDTKGNILSYEAPDKVVKLKKVSLSPLLKFLNEHDHPIIFGDDPRNPGELKTFSAVEVRDNGQLTGYVYIVLASQEYVAAAKKLMGNYILGLSVRSVIVILFVSAMVGLFAIWFITRKLGSIVAGIREFHAGNLQARIPVKSKDELDKIGMVFNEMAATIAQNIQVLKDTDEFRKDLISNVSHDLRTPIASIQGYAETLLLKRDSIIQADQQRYLEIIFSACEKLKKLVDELFELSKLQTNQVKLIPEPFSINELVLDIITKYRIISEKKGISINTFLSKDIPRVQGDILLIERVLQNIMDNAIKFCKEGDFITIDIHPKGEEKIEVTIADSGEGIHKDELPYIFERYYKGKKYSDSTGLGLAIVKKIMDLHHESIQVKSQLGKGSEFSFLLPVTSVA